MLRCEIVAQYSVKHIEKSEGNHLVCVSRSMIGGFKSEVQRRYDVSVAAS